MTVDRPEMIDMTMTKDWPEMFDMAVTRLAWMIDKTDNRWG